ncbi:MAG TPA: HAD-IIA family hydrolase [Dermatophilaceae bacterium]|nr:HAD-IIA family hydrolase [Dermatophilaceae bacterium]
MSLLDRYAGVVCDLDGVVYRGEEAVPGAIEALGDAALPVRYATNNASRPPADVARQLRSLGLTLEDADVVTSSQAGAGVLLERVGTAVPVLPVGGEGVRAALLELGLAVADRSTPAAEPGAVLQGYGPAVAATDLAEVAYAVQRGAVWVATNTDATLPTERGMAPGNGALVAAVRCAVGRDPDVVAGKPFPPLYLLCAQRLGTDVARVLAIGDRLETDIEGAVRTGMDSVLVLTGVHTLRDAALAGPERRPTWVLPNLSWLHRPVAGPIEDAAAALRAIHADVDAGRLDAGGVAERLSGLVTLLGTASPR